MYIKNIKSLKMGDVRVRHRVGMCGEQKRPFFVLAAIAPLFCSIVSLLREGIHCPLGKPSRIPNDSVFPSSVVSAMRIPFSTCPELVGGKGVEGEMERRGRGRGV